MSSFLASFQKSNSEDIRFEMVKVKGKDLLDVRIYTSLLDGAEKAPTGKGFFLSAANFSDFKKALNEIQPALEREGFVK